MEFPKEELLQYLNLRPKSQAENTSRPITWIPQLGPVTTYQAWQLATTGNVAIAKQWLKASSQKRMCDKDNTCSEKEELGELCIRSKSESLGKSKTNKNSCSDISEDADKSRHPKGKVPSMDRDPKLCSTKKKPTQFSECCKAFRSHHQLVLHSRVYKKYKRAGAPSPTISIDGRQPGTCFPELTTREKVSAALEQEVVPNGLNLDKNAVGGKEKQPKSSRECSYCGKCFHSNSYLHIHLRTHTGEKVYNCNFCDYSAAQKSSLRYHLKRHHKDKHPVDVATKVKSDGQNQDMEDALLTDSVQTRNLKRVLDGAKDVQGSPPAKQPREMTSVFPSVLSGAGLSPGDSEPKDFWKNATDYREKLSKYPGPAWLSLAGGQRVNMEREDCKYKPSSDCQDRLLTLPLGTLQTCPSISLKTSHIPAITCFCCTFKTFTHEVIMSRRLHHKFTSDMLQNCKSKSELRSQKTSCPPALPHLSGWKKLQAKAAFQTPKSLPREKVPSKAPQFSGAESSTLAPGNIKFYRPQPCTEGLRATTQQKPELLPKGGMSADVDEVKRPEQKLEPLTTGPPFSPFSSNNGNSSIENPLNCYGLWAPQGRDYFCHQNANSTTAEFKEPLPQSLNPSMVALGTQSIMGPTAEGTSKTPGSMKWSVTALLSDCAFPPSVLPPIDSFLNPVQEESPAFWACIRTTATESICTPVDRQDTQ